LRPDIHYRLANESDIDELVKLRIEFLHEVAGGNGGDSSGLQASLPDYFKSAFVDGSYICWIAEDSGKIAGLGGMAIWTKPGNFKSPNGRIGYIMNMYTLKSHRRMGICRELLKLLENSAKQQDISILEMHATLDGEPVYRQAGYAEPVSKVLELNLR
jgi:ribosomal protein S18 acetylase RimI-like enzyme